MAFTIVSKLDTNEHLHCVFVYCYEHDQGAVAIITHNEWLDITNNTEDYYEKIFKYVDSMCGNNLSHRRINTWESCGELEYTPHNQLLQGQYSVKKNFDREGGGWKFEYFKNELFTLGSRIEIYKLPKAIREFLSHLDVPYPYD